MLLKKLGEEELVPAAVKPVTFVCPFEAKKDLCQLDGCWICVTSMPVHVGV